MEPLSGTLLLIQVGVILLTARAVGFVFQRLRQPSVVAEIVAGLALGPSLLGRLWPEAMGAIFPADSLGALDVLAQIGLILFMFVIGMEFDPRRIQRRTKVAGLLSLSSITLPFALGVGLGLAMHPGFAPTGIGRLPFALFIGAASCVTAFPVLARIMSEHGLMRTEIGALAMTCAAINDAAAWCLLAIVIAVVQAGDPASAITTSLLTLAYLAFMMGAVRPVASRLLRFYQTRTGIARSGLAALLILLLGSALLTHLIGVHALFGAFVFGAILPRDERPLRALALRMEDLVIVLFLPIFFAVTGLRTEAGALDSPELWTWLLILVGVATLGKVVGAGLPALLAGHSRRESATLGVLMNTRGLMELIILEIGRQLGVLTPLLFTMFVLMAIATTLMTAPLLAVLFPRERVLEARAAAAPSRAPLARPSFSLMTCVASPESVPAMALLSSAISHGPDARAYAVTLLSTRASASLFPESAPAIPHDEDPAAMLTRAAAPLGLTMDALSLASSDVPRDILHVATLKKADLILAGVYRPLFGQSPLGGPLAEVARSFDGDLVLLADHGLRQIRRVIALRGGPHTAAIGRVLARMNDRGGLEITWKEAAEFERSISDLEGVDLVVMSAPAAQGRSRERRGLYDAPALMSARCSALIVCGPDADA